MSSAAGRGFWVGWSSMGFLRAVQDDRPSSAVIHSLCLAVWMSLILWDRANDEVRNG